MFNSTDLPIIGPEVGIVVGAAFIVVALLVQYIMNRQVLSRTRQGLLPRLELQRLVSEAQMRRVSRKTGVKQLRDGLGPFLGKVSIRVRGGVPLRDALRQVAEGLPPDALTTMVLAALRRAESNPQTTIFAELKRGAGELRYRPLRIAFVKLELVAKYGGDMPFALRESGKHANVQRLHELSKAAMRVQMKMSVLMVFFLLPALMLIMVMPQLVEVLRSLGQVGGP